MAKGRPEPPQGSFDFGPPKSEEIVPPYPGGPPAVAPKTPSARAPSTPTSPTSRPEPAKPRVASMAVPGPASRPEPPPPLTVSDLGRLVERVLSGTFEEGVVVTGEAVGVRFAQSGHLYFTLRDEDIEAAIDVVVYRTNVTPRSRALVRDGAKLLLRGRPTYYSPRGRLQFVADRVGLSGKGAILEALEKLKATLAAEGLFREEKKRKLPHEPRTIGVVTSRTGAVIHDICRVAFRRGGARILLAPALVQGSGAAVSIVRALETLQRVPEVDVILVARGGGGADDLSAFNEEAVVRAVAACKVPVVSAVGHEVDVTLVDFAADARASTPSQAAELVVPDGRARASLLAERRRGLVRAMHARLGKERLSLANIGKTLGDPRVLVATSQQRLDERRARVVKAMTRVLETYARAQRNLAARALAQNPRTVLANEREALKAVEFSLRRAAQHTLFRGKTELARLSSRLDAMSPLKVLGRGYAIVTRADGRAVRSADEVTAGDRVRLRVAEGELRARIERGDDDEGPEGAPG